MGETTFKSLIEVEEPHSGIKEPETPLIYK